MPALITYQFHDLLYMLNALLLFLILSPKAAGKSKVRKLLFIVLLCFLTFFYIGFEDVDPFLYVAHLIPLSITLAIMIEGFVTGAIAWLFFNVCSYVYYHNPLLPVLLTSTFLLAAGLVLYYKGAFQKSFLYTCLYSSGLISAYVLLIEGSLLIREGISSKHVLALLGTYASGIIVNYVYYQIRKQERLKDELILSEKNHIVSQLTAAISHEIRNPLTTVRGFLQLMAGKELPQDQRDHYIRYAMEGIDQANSIITDYLSFARPAAEQRRLICPRDEINFILPLIQPLAVLSNVQIEWPDAYAEPAALILGESGKLRQILLNLLKNSIESMADGGTLSIRVAVSDTDVSIHIEDTGVGMTQEQIKRIGMPFYTTKEKGTGLGMMVVISLLKSMNGKLDISSRSHQGTLCSLRFKREKAGEAVAVGVL